MTAAAIAARKIMLAALEAAHVNWKNNVVNPAITQLNLATPTDSGLVPLANILTDAVLKINLYHPEIDRLIAETNAMVPTDPIVTTETQALPCPVGQGGAITQTRTKTVTNGVATATPWVTVSNTCVDTPPPPPPPVLVGGITLVSVPSVPQWAQGMKHVSACVFLDGRIYFNNGDYRGYDGKYDQSYMQETCSVDIGLLLAAKTQEEITAAFRLEYPYEGFGGTTVQPKHPDFMGWVLDRLRKVIWLVPGQTFASNSVAPGETTLGHDDPCFKYGVFTFDPAKPMTAATPRWTFKTSDRGPNNQETWFSVINGDTLYRAGFNGGTGSVIDHVDLSTLDAGAPEWKTNGIGDGSWRINKEYIAHDVEGLKFYAIDGIKNRVMSFSFVDFSVEDLGPSPGKAADAENYSLLVWNSKHKLLEFLNSYDATLYVADATVRPLVWKVAATGMINHRMGVYDPGHDCTLWAGGNAAIGGFNQMTIFRAAPADMVLP